MGSALLYFAIVVMWLSVLLPMWLRRDRHDDEDGYGEQPGEAVAADSPDAEAPTAAGAEDSPADPDNVDTMVEAPADSDRSKSAQTAAAVAGTQRRGRGRRRARIIARRRRRLLWCVLIVLASVVTAAVRVMPWWGVAPSGVLLVGYLVMLRVAARADREQRERAARARAERLRKRRELRQAMQREAEVVELKTRPPVQLFDQYADRRRAAGD